MKLIFKLTAILFLIFFLLPLKTLARDPSTITDWYIKDFAAEINLEKDSTMVVTENITADCDGLPDKHGIFRVLPTEVKRTDTKIIKTPVELISITDNAGGALKYSQTENYSDHTITWKIGDPEVTVKGENKYIIKYRVKNVIRSTGNLDEFYWNLSGNFWQIDIDSFSANVNFPSGFDHGQSELNLYSGSFGSQEKEASATWTAGDILNVTSNKVLKSGEGITLSATYPKGFFSPYVPSFWEKNWPTLTLSVPLLALIICLALWARYGRDPKIGGPIVPEFEVPGKLLPMDFGMVITNGNLRSQYISAGIIDLAVKKVLKIEGLKDQDYKLILSEKKPDNLTPSEDLLLEKLFGASHEVKISELKNQFYKDIEPIESLIRDHLKSQDLVNDSGFCSQFMFIFLAIVFFSPIFFLFPMSVLAGLNFLLASIIFIIFIFLIPRRTVTAARFLKKVEGFKLYMKTAEKYRQQFNEKENIFEKYLPYAMVFGLTGLWIAKMKEIYGQGYFDSYHPAWFYGAAITFFNADSFNSSISALSSSMSSTLASSPSSSGSGGGGFSGGGGGGGGW